MSKDLAYYMNLKYEIVITPIPESNGGGYEASIPELGRFTFIGDGETIKEAVADLEETKNQNFRELIAAGDFIPEPKMDRDEYSGKLLVRIPKYLHRHLADQAKLNGVSLNQHMASLLSMGIPVIEIKRTLRAMCDLWRSAVYKYEADIMKQVEEADSYADFKAA